MNISRLMMICLVLTGFAIPVSADVVYFTNGEKQEGIVSPAAGDADSIMLRTSKGEVKVAKSRVKSVEEQSDAKDIQILGDQYFASKQYQQSIDAYNEAKKLSKDSTTDLDERISAAQAALERLTNSQRRDEVASAGSMIDQAEKDIAAQSFASAQDALEKKITPLNPSEEQQKQILELRKKLYRAWGKERLDKLAQDSAADKFEALLKLDPYDVDAYNHLIDIWSKIPEKNPQVIEAYKTRLEIDPNDNSTRKNLAEKYMAETNFEEAAKQYEVLYKSGQFKGSQIEANMVKAISTLYKQAANTGDYDKAVDYYKKMMDYVPSTDPKTLQELEFEREWKKTSVQDIDTRTTLVLKAKEAGMENLATRKLAELASIAPDNASVKVAKEVYAKEMLQKAEAALQNQKYGEALSLSNKIIRDYPFIAAAHDRALEIAGLARQSLLAEGRQRKEVAQQYKEQGDLYLSKAQGYIEIISNQEQIDASRQSGSQTTFVRIRSPKQEAIEASKLAMDYYDQALSTFPQMDQIVRQEIAYSRAKARQYYTRLTNKTPMNLPRTPHSLGK